jgi:pimeloyl-ACP methyl ester carboxylesterase
LAAVLPELAKHCRVIAPDLLGHGQSDKPRTDYSLGAFAASLRDLLDELGISGATIVGHSLGGGVAMQFLYQHPEYCRRLILISSGGLGPDVGWILRLLAAPGAELVLPVIAPKVVLRAGNQMRSWLSTVGLSSPRAGPIWDAYCSLADPPTRSAFLRTLRSVVDYRGQSVNALSRLCLRIEMPTLVIWGDRDAIIPVEHGSAVPAARPGSRLAVLPGLGHFPTSNPPLRSSPRSRSLSPLVPLRIVMLYNTIRSCRHGQVYPEQARTAERLMFQRVGWPTTLSHAGISKLPSAC